jgi:hypothetical protein
LQVPQRLFSFTNGSFLTNKGRAAQPLEKPDPCSFSFRWGP